MDLDLLNKIDVAKATGLDGITISHTLCLIFNASIMCSIFPDEWKYAKVCPIHKKDSTDDLNDYRPISVISAQAIVKLLERIINNHTIRHYFETELLGFVPCILLFAVRCY